MGVNYRKIAPKLKSITSITFIRIHSNQGLNIKFSKKQELAMVTWIMNLKNRNQSLFRRGALIATGQSTWQEMQGLNPSSVPFA